VSESLVGKKQLCVFVLLLTDLITNGLLIVMASGINKSQKHKIYFGIH